MHNFTGTPRKINERSIKINGNKKETIYFFILVDIPKSKIYMRILSHLLLDLKSHIAFF